MGLDDFFRYYLPKIEDFPNYKNPFKIFGNFIIAVSLKNHALTNTST
ncbi:MAG: hypothetical protein FWH29_07005 [Methanobrevibacter sp.]|nr:hypothetical protein [Methanobrevibacter sp.]